MAVSLSLLLLAALCAVSYAQPAPPTMSNTFQGSGDVEFHGPEETIFGKFLMARDQMNKMGVEVDEYEEGHEHGPGELTEVLNLYNVNKTYFLRGNDRERPHCIEEDRNFNNMPEFWDWLGYSTYEGTVHIREVLFDLWGTNVGGVRFEFGKPQSNSSIQYIYRRKTAESAVFFAFMNYTATPDPKLFEVPEVCKNLKHD